MNGTLQIWKARGSYQDYRNDKALRSEAFLNYMTIVVKLFGSAVGLFLRLALGDFHRKVLNLATIYR